MKELENLVATETATCYFALGRQIFCWNTTTREQPALFKTRESHVTSITTSKNSEGSRVLFDVCLNGKLRETIKDREVRTFSRPTTSIAAVPAIAHQKLGLQPPTADAHSHLFSMGWDGTYAAYEPISGDAFNIGKSRTPPILLGTPYGILWSLRGTIYSGDMDNYSKLMDLPAPGAYLYPSLSQGFLVNHFNDFGSHPAGAVLHTNTGQLLHRWDPTYYGKESASGIYYREGRPYFLIVTQRKEAGRDGEAVFVGYSQALCRRPGDSEFFEVVFTLHTTRKHEEEWEIKGTNAFCALFRSHEEKASTTPT